MNKPPSKKLFTHRVSPEFGLTHPLETPSTPADNPFEDQLTLIDQGQVAFGISGGRGIDLRSWPSELNELLRFIFSENLLNLSNWIPEAQSPELRMQNLIGASFVFVF